MSWMYRGDAAIKEVVMYKAFRRYRASLLRILCRLDAFHVWKTIQVPENGDGPALFMRQCLRCPAVEVYMDGWIHVDEFCKEN